MFVLFVRICERTFLHREPPHDIGNIPHTQTHTHTEHMTCCHRHSHDTANNGWVTVVVVVVVVSGCGPSHGIRFDVMTRATICSFEHKHQQHQRLQQFDASHVFLLPLCTADYDGDDGRRIRYDNSNVLCRMSLSIGICVVVERCRRRRRRTSSRWRRTFLCNVRS